eukprot:101489_1
MSHYNSYIHRPLVKSNGIYEVGQLIEVYDSVYKIWSVAQIIDIKNNKIKITWYGWNHKYDEWITKNDTAKSCPLQTHTFPMKPLSKPPHEICCSSKEVLLHNSHIIFNTQIKYNFKMNQWFIDKSSPLKSEENMNRTAVIRTIDHKNEIIFDVDKRGNVHAFNTKTKEWNKHNDSPNLYVGSLGWRTLCCQLIENKLYLINFLRSNYIYDINSKHWTILDKPTYSHPPSHTYDSCEIIHIKSQKIFIAFDRYCRNVYYCKYNSNHWIKKDELSAINKFVS